MKKFVTFGEIMLRLKSPDHERFFQSPFFEASFGGGEANVAISLAQFGLDVAFVSILPDNDISRACIREISKYGVDVSRIIFGTGRLGIYFLEAGANQRPSKVIYDRSGTAISTVAPDSINWNEIFKAAQWFHITGITPALSENSAKLSIDAVRIAKEMGLTVSCDLNYRAKLWNYGKTAPEVMGEIIKYADICVANEEDIQKSLGLDINVTIERGNLDLNQYQRVSGQLIEKYPNVKLVTITLRESFSASHNNWSACSFDGNEFLVSEKFSINNIVDRVGGGDSFSAGLIYGLNTYENKKDALEFAVAASCLKHSIIGDYNLVSVSEVEQLMRGDKSGRVQR